MTIRNAGLTIAAWTVMLAGIGGSIGWALGTCKPGYYRSVFRNGNDPEFDPVSVGIGQGVTQGTAGGTVVGVIVVALFVWRDVRMQQGSAPGSPSSPGNSSNAAPPVKRYV